MENLIHDSSLCHLVTCVTRFYLQNIKGSGQSVLCLGCLFVCIVKLEYDDDNDDGDDDDDDGDGMTSTRTRKKGR